MDDNTPSTTNTQAAGAVSITGIASGLRRQVLWIGDIFDPDTMPANDIEKYVVPKENWLVWSLTGNVLVWYYVYKVYQNKSELKLCESFMSEGTTTEDQDSIFGKKGGPLSGEGIMGVDYASRPNRASIDSTVMRPGATHAYLFLGDNIDVDNGGVIISAVYDKSNNLVTNKIPVSLAAIENYTNKEIMWADMFSVTRNADALPNGARCTLVFFDGDMVITPSQRITVQHASYLRHREKGIRYVTDIELISTWFTDSNDPDKLIIPITTPIIGIEFRAVVHYNDGSNVEHPVNGGKFQLLGVDEHTPTSPGETSSLSLIYTLGTDEEFYIAEPGVEGKKKRQYQVMAGNVQGAYAPKIYTYPFWDSANSQWDLASWMYDLDRNTLIDVASKLTLSESSPAFRPRTYNTEQDLIFILNLKDVSPEYRPMPYRQTTSLILYSDLNGPDKRWGVSYSADKPFYDAKFASTINSGATTKVSLKNGYSTVDDWLAALYWSVTPAFDQFNEEKAPTPNAFYLMTLDGYRYPGTVADWDKAITVGSSQVNGQTLLICWVYKDANGSELQLALTGVTVSLSS